MTTAPAHAFAQSQAGAAGAEEPRPTTHRGTIAYLPALDGLRALAVGAVIAFHFGIAGVSGGFLGVDIFFVLSGFLITSLLTAEWSSSGRVSLASFWGRRARRLFPALFVTLVGVSVAGALLDTPSQLSSLRGDALSTLGYFANWHYIAASQNYFVHFGLPSPLLHTWSLAVEEQFYLLWPLITVAVVTFVARRLRRAVLAVIASVGALASAAWMAVDYGSHLEDISRLYFGTDTHAQVILVGAALALARPGASWVASRTRRAILWLVASCGALFTAWEVHAVLATAPLHPGSGFGGKVAWFFDGVLGSQDFLYRGGFLLVSLSVAAVIALVVSLRDAWPSRALAFGPLRYVGRISYGLYLYHWPTFTFLNPQTTGLTGTALLLSRLAITAAASIVSFHLLETPIRKGLNERLSVRHQLGLLLPAGAACVVAAILAGTGLPAGASLKKGPLSVSTLPAGAQPAKILLVGDSVALTLGIGLSHGDAAYNVSLDNEGQLGCSIAETGAIEVSGTIWPASSPVDPCVPASGGKAGQSWQQFWPPLLAKDRPDVVAVLFGRWEAVNREFDGHWTHLGEAAYDHYLSAQLTQAVELLGSTGAKVALLTAPYYDEPPAPDGSQWPENDPHRVDVWNSILRSVAASIDAKQPGQVTVIDLGKILDPQGHYAAFVDGVPVRCPDGVHTSYQAGEYVQPYVLPTLERLASQAYHQAAPQNALSPVGTFAQPPTPTPAALRRKIARSFSLTEPFCPYGPGG